MKNSILQRTFNRIVHRIARSALDYSSLRPFLHKLRGVKTYGTVFIGDEAYLENEIEYVLNRSVILPPIVQQAYTALYWVT